MLLPKNLMSGLHWKVRRLAKPGSIPERQSWDLCRELSCLLQTSTGLCTHVTWPARPQQVFEVLTPGQDHESWRAGTVPCAFLNPKHAAPFSHSIKEEGGRKPNRTPYLSLSARIQNWYKKVLSSVRCEKVTIT